MATFYEKTNEKKNVNVIRHMHSEQQLRQDDTSITQ